TGLDRHTICENKQKLLEKGLIVYTGEKRGRTKSIDVIRLTYVKGREHSHPDANQPSSVKKPTAQKSSSEEMPIAKQCGNAHTESLSIEPLITTTTTTDNQDSKSSSSVFNKEIDKELLALRNKYIPKDDRENIRFLKQCKWHVDHGSKEHTFNQRVSGLKKIIRGGCFDVPANYPKPKQNGTGESDLIVYSRYVNGLKNDVALKLLPPDTHLPDFEEWQRNKNNVPS